MTEAIKIKTLDNGPFVVNGSVELTDAKGKKFQPEHEPIALCRCGASAKRPFCDGCHTKINFQSAERAAGQVN